jgi:hypothetical protein
MFIYLELKNVHLPIQNGLFLQITNILIKILLILQKSRYRKEIISRFYGYFELVPFHLFLYQEEFRKDSRNKWLLRTKCHIFKYRAYWISFRGRNKHCIQISSFFVIYYHILRLARNQWFYKSYWKSGCFQGIYCDGRFGLFPIPTFLRPFNRVSIRIRFPLKIHYFGSVFFLDPHPGIKAW